MSEPLDVSIRETSIDLDQFLKFAGAVGSGGEVKYYIGEGMVTVNGEPGTRRRRKLVVGDVACVTDVGTFRVASAADESSS